MSLYVILLKGRASLQTSCCFYMDYVITDFLLSKSWKGYYKVHFITDATLKSHPL